MSTLSVPLTPELESFINFQVKLGKAPTKAAVVRQAILRFSEEEAIQAVLDSERDVREGKIFRGDLLEIAKKLRK